MTDKELITLAQQEGFTAAVIPTSEVVVDYGFRKFCEDNLCGKYGANYSCPPDCGTPQQVHEKLMSRNSALVLEKICPINGYDDRETIQKYKKAVNFSVLDVSDKMAAAGYNVLPLGYGGCPLCTPCQRALGKPCTFPERKISCISAYCINVTELSASSGLEFGWSEEKLYLFGMVLFDR
ncbi:MAG: DUF2284 domain-containing protein [Oscillospiraceae bacterium]|nr:DUF2284 domain-containing protein [Oscillospiraceae bacterium]